jgi:hypothetical protein
MERNIQARLCNHCCSGKVMSIIYSECVFVALDIHYAMRMPQIVICGLPGSTNFSTLSHKKYDFGMKFLNIKCVFWLAVKVLSETFLIQRRNE